MRNLTLLWFCSFLILCNSVSFGQSDASFDALHAENLRLLWKSPEKAVNAEKTLYSTLKSDSLRSVSSRLIAVGYSIQNQWDSAMVYHYQSLYHARDAQSEHLLGLSHNNIGLAHLHLQDSAEAEIQLKQAEPYLIKHASSSEMGNFYRSLFLVTPAVDVRSRKESLYTAIDHHSATVDSSGLTFCYGQLSMLVPDSAEEYLSFAVQYTDSLKEPCDHASNLYVEAKIALRSGRLDQSINLLERALEINQASEVCQQPFDILLTLSEAHEMKRDFSKARSYLNAYYTLRSKENQKKALATSSTYYLKQLNLELSQLREKHASDVQRIADLTESKTTAEVNLTYSRILNAVIIVALICMVVLSVFLIRNVKENKRKKSELDEKVNELSDALDRLKSSDEALKSTQMQLIQAEKLTSLGTLVAGVAHEINNPLHYLHSGIYLLRSKLPEFENQTEEEEFCEIIDLMEKGVEEASSIVGNLKQFSRKQDYSAHTTINLNETIERSLQLLEHKIRKGPKRIPIHASATYAIQANEGSVIQIFTNLILNAIFASPEPDSIHISIYEAQSEFVRVDVVDQGCGIDEAIISQIFDPFFTTKPTGEGTGLGLSIVHSLVSEQHGTIGLESKLGEGTTFSVYFPFVK